MQPAEQQKHNCIKRRNLSDEKMCKIVHFSVTIIGKEAMDKVTKVASDFIMFGVSHVLFVTVSIFLFDL